MRHLHKRTMGLEGTERGLHPALSQKKLDLRINAETVTVGADATVYVRLLFTHVYLAQKPYICRVASAPAVIGAVFLRRFVLFLGQCGGA